MHFDKNQSLDSAKKALKMAVFLTVSFMVIEFLGGVFSNSLALIGDALHMLTDSIALSISLIAVILTQKSLSKTHWEKYGALINGILVIILSLTLISRGIERLSTPFTVKEEFVIGIGSIGLLINLYVAKLLHSSQKDNLNVRGAYLHVLGDLLGSIGAIVSGILIAKTGKVEIDSYICIGIGLLVLWSGVKLLKDLHSLSKKH